jgi:hypothetical protein
VKIANLENLLGHFDSLKEILAKEPYGNRIAYKENELGEDGKKKDIPIEDVLSYILCFDVEDFDHSHHPIKAYAGKTSVVKHYKANPEKMKKYFSLAPDILDLRDMICSEMPLIWNETGNDLEGGRWGKIVGVKNLKEKRMLPFSTRKSKFVNPAGFIYPALAAFRPLVEIQNGKVNWKEKPSTIFESVGEEITKLIAETAKRISNPNQMGKDNNIWQVCYQTVEREIWKRKL